MPGTHITGVTNIYLIVSCMQPSTASIQLDHCRNFSASYTTEHMLHQYMYTTYTTTDSEKKLSQFTFLISRWNVLCVQQE